MLNPWLWPWPLGPGSGCSPLAQVMAPWAGCLPSFGVLGRHPLASVMTPRVGVAPRRAGFRPLGPFGPGSLGRGGSLDSSQAKTYTKFDKAPAGRKGILKGLLLPPSLFRSSLSLSPAALTGCGGVVADTAGSSNLRAQREHGFAKIRWSPAPSKCHWARAENVQRAALPKCAGAQHVVNAPGLAPKTFEGHFANMCLSPARRGGLEL